MQRNGSKSLDRDPSEDICPICKSNRYLNPKLEFLINPECYHKMCSTCVDRIFTSGPASCPVPYCGKTLRKRGFHRAFFGDLKVEREVDIRKRVGAVFNRRQDEFETLLDWNNYLEKVENLIFDLVQGTRDEKMQAEEELRQYRESNVTRIEENKRVGLEAVEMERRREKAEKEALRLRRQAAAQEAEAEKKDIAQMRQEVLERLALTDEDANIVTQNIILKKSKARRAQKQQQVEDDASGRRACEGLTIRGLKKHAVATAEEAYDPFGGIVIAPVRYVIQNNYESEWLAPAKRDDKHIAGGYSFREYYSRTLFEAFSGLGVMVGDGDYDGDASDTTVSTTARSQAAGRVISQYLPERPD